MWETAERPLSPDVIIPMEKNLNLNECVNLIMNAFKKMKTKASQLSSIIGKIKSAKLLEQVSFTKYEWDFNKKECLKKCNSLEKNIFACRSSALDEDQNNESNAGKYLSILNVQKEELENSIEKVFSSYGNKSNGDEILVQPMLQDVLAFNWHFQVSEPLVKV